MRACYAIKPLTSGGKAWLYAFRAQDGCTSCARWPCPRMNLLGATHRCKRPQAFPHDSARVCRIIANLCFRMRFARMVCRSQEQTPECQAELERVEQYARRFGCLPVDHIYHGWRFALGEHHLVVSGAILILDRS